MTSDNTIRVLIADDHPIVRAGLRAVVESAPDISVVAEAATTDEAIQAVRDSLNDGASDAIDLVLMDLRFGDAPGSTTRAGGVDATSAIRGLSREGYKAPEVLVVTNYSSDSDVLGAITAGAVGYLLKDTDPGELIEGIRRAAKGETVLSNQVAGRLMGRMRNPISALTPRELEVLELVAAGMSNRKIAEHLVLTEATVKSHLVHIFTKLGVSSRTAAVAKAQERGILGE
ncbi:LuxR C-terminal-related transcriptional regulator [Corynebacterium lactis]|uniref:LuxR family transcriptional regulator n=1 Tax=Corynebacterium lactis RW2-5 TaxID=1408189 RepID=A0A0K2GYP8_9CORY|nr:response regulator transcription factor [Corynebacterium lactis]ALA66909.1 LuxR family transcriptional regulator [Corynebacterium lactis RW2-5]